MKARYDVGWLLLGRQRFRRATILLLSTVLNRILLRSLETVLIWAS